MLLFVIDGTYVTLHALTVKAGEAYTHIDDISPNILSILSILGVAIRDERLSNVMLFKKQLEIKRMECTK